MLRLLRPVTPTVTPEIDCGAACLATPVTLLRLFPDTYTYIGAGLFRDYLLSLYRGGVYPGSVTTALFRNIPCGARVFGVTVTVTGVTLCLRNRDGHCP